MSFCLSVDTEAKDVCDLVVFDMGKIRNDQYLTIAKCKMYEEE